MADSIDRATSILLCSENSSTCFDGLENIAPDEFRSSNSLNHRNNEAYFGNPTFDLNISSESFVGFPLQSEESVRQMIEREGERLPGNDYLKRLRSGDLDLSVRREALDWIWKAHSYFNFGPLSFCLAANYLDRYLSSYEMPRNKTWTVQLLAVACLSLAAKVEETKVPQIVDLQVGEPKFVFEAKTIQRMELLVLSRLGWRVQDFTPCSFIDHFLNEMRDEQQLSKLCICRSVEIIVRTIRGIDFLEFRPSEIAAAVAIYVLSELQGVEIDKAMSCSSVLEKGRVMKCLKMIKGMSFISESTSVGRTLASYVPQSPAGVLDGACLSYKSEEVTVGSCANSSHNSPVRKGNLY